MRYRSLSQSEHKSVKSRRSVRRWRGELELLDQRRLLATFTVTNLGSDPLVPGTLAWAITSSNSTQGVLDTIEFALPGISPHRIALSQALPQITDAVVIDGTTQPGFDPFDPRPVVEINGDNIGTVTLNPPDFIPTPGVNGFVIETLSSSGTILRGLSIGGFTGAGVVIQNSDGVAIEGSHIGADATGLAMMMNCSAGIIVQNSTNIRIGGTVDSQFNIVSGNGSSGIVFIGVTNATIQGNKIGVDRSGIVPMPNHMDGINLTNSSGVLIGVPTPTAPNPSPLPPIGSGSPGEFLTNPAGQNLIAANGRDGVVIWGPAAADSLPPATILNRVLNNKIGFEHDIVDSSGAVLSTVNLGNKANGVYIGNNSSGNLIQQNLIESNGANGVAILSGNYNALFANEYYKNADLGIDLNYDGQTPNDVDDSDLGANFNLNFPTLLSAMSNTLTTTITGRYEGAPNTTFSIQVYTNPSAFTSTSVQGKAYLGYIQVTTNASGVANFTFLTTYPLGIGERVTAIASDLNGNTSEISGYVTVQSAPTDMGISLNLNPASIAVGGSTTITSTVTNNGPSTAIGVVVEVVVPVGFTISNVVVSPGISPVVNGNIVTVVYPGAFANQRSESVAVTVVATALGTFPVTTKVQSDSSDVQPSNNTASANLVVADPGSGSGGGTGGGGTGGGGTGGGGTGGGGTGGGGTGGGGTQPTDTLPRVTSVRRIRQSGRLRIAVSYDIAMDTNSVQNASNYYFVLPGRDNKFGTADDKVVGATSAVYDAATMTVFVTPYQPHTISSRSMRISILGATSTGVRSQAGQPLDGMGNGTASNYTGVVPQIAPTVRKASLPRVNRKF